MKYISIIALIIYCITGAGKTSHAQDTLLYHYMQMASDNNPALQSKFKDYYASLEKVPQVGTLPDPKVVLGYYILPVETRVGAGRANIQLSQSFPWFGTLAAKKDEASSWAAIKFERFQSAKNDLFYQLKLKYYQLYFISKSIDSREDYLAILKKNEKLSLSKFAAGSSMADVLRVQMSAEENKAQLLNLRDKWQSLSADFNKLLNRPLTDSVAVADSLLPPDIAFDKNELKDRILHKNTSLHLLRQKDTAYQKGLVVARKVGQPSLGLGINYSLISPRTDMQIAKNGQDILMPMLSLDLPLHRSKYRAKEKEVKLMQESNRLQMADMKNALSAKLVGALSQYEQAVTNAKLYQQLLKKADQTYQILATAYSSGTESYIEVLRIEEKILGYQLNLQQAIVDQYQAVALLDQLTAKEL